MKPRIILLLLLTFLGIGYMTYRWFRSSNIDKEITRELIANSVILDVRTGWEYERGSLPNSINIKMSDLRTLDIPIAKDKSIITYCSHGIRSIKAKKILKKRGYAKVYNGGSIDDLQSYFDKK